MHTRKRAIPPAEPTHAPRERVPLALALPVSTPDMSSLTPAQRDTLRAIRLELASASMCGPHDLRLLLGLAGQARDQWMARREVWASELLRNDPRVGDR